MKRLTLVLSIVILSTIDALSWDGLIAPQYAGGDGTENNPYQIETPEQLALLAKKVNDDHITYQGNYFVLTADIDLFGKSGEDTIQWIPIGIVAEDVTFNGEDKNPNHHPFMGSFDGCDHIINNLYINNSELSNAGLFGHIGHSNIKNVIMDNVNVHAKDHAAALCAQSSYGSFITNCKILGGVVVVEENYAAGVVSYIKSYLHEAWSNYVSDQKRYFYMSSVYNCTNYASVISKGVYYSGGMCNWAGGIIGMAAGSTGWNPQSDETLVIKKCTNYGQIYGVNDIGGVCGYFACGVGTPQISEITIIDSCANYGDVIMTETHAYEDGVGGIVGHVLSNGVIQHCLNSGTLINANDVNNYEYDIMRISGTGGIVGTNLYCGIKRSVNIGSANYFHNFGGICGYHYSSCNIEYCMSAAFSNPSSDGGRTGGIVGELGTNSKVIDCVVSCFENNKGYNYDIKSSIVSQINWQSFPPPTNLFAIKVNNCYFDKQWNSYDREQYGEVNEDYGQLFTHQMLCDNLKGKLSDSDWVFTDGMYPRPKGVENYDIAVLAATPVFLFENGDEDYDDAFSVNHSLVLGDVDGIHWSTNSPLDINDRVVTITGSVPEDSMYSICAHYGDAVRYYKFYAKSSYTPTSVFNIENERNINSHLLRNTIANKSESIAFRNNLEGDFKIFSMQGKIIAEGKIGEKILAPQTSGCYVLSLTDSSGKHYREKFVVK